MASAQKLEIIALSVYLGRRNFLEGPPILTFSVPSLFLLTCQNRIHRMKSHSSTTWTTFVELHFMDERFIVLCEYHSSDERWHGVAELWEANKSVFCKLLQLFLLDFLLNPVVEKVVGFMVCKLVLFLFQ